tara:strand:- start:7937 stop:8290 length:354 start_codon:yes stop_codon:yes gene_type:complete
MKTLMILVLTLLMGISQATAHGKMSGKASWYGPGFHGRTTANGERYNQNASTCAHKTLRFGTMVKILNLKNKKTATCRINDRGPYAGGRIIDVSKAIAKKLGMIASGVARVAITIIR